MTRLSLRIAFALSFVCASCVISRAAELKGKFVLAAIDPVPALQPVVDPKAAADYPKLKLVHEDLVVDPQTRGIANIAVYVRTPNPPITEAAKRAAPPTTVIDVWFGQFKPRISGVWVGSQRLIVESHDAVMHNPSLPVANASPLLPPPTRIVEIPIDQAKLLPKEISCNIHPWMKGYVLLRDNPYFAATAHDGSFSIKHLPTGVPLEFQVWHEKTGFLNADPTWTKGRFTITLDADRDLGTINVPRAAFR